MVCVQYPKTPKVTPLTLAMGIALTMGVDMVARTSRTKARKKRIVKGVAGRSIVTYRPSKVITMREDTWCEKLTLEGGAVVSLA